MDTLLRVGSDFIVLLGDAALRGTVILLLALLATYFLRHRPAAFRHLVWTCAIAAQLALPLFALWGPHWALAIPARVSTLVPIPLPVAAERNPIAAPTATKAPASASESRTTPYVPLEKSGIRDASGVSASATPPRRAELPARAGLSPMALLLWIWIAGASLVLLRLIVGTVAVASFARRGARVDDGSWLSLMQRLSTSLGIGRPLTLMRGDKLGVPVTWGILYPVVMLPDDADTWPEERRRFVLVHEMAHVKRLDALTQLVGQVTLALFWFNPLVWVAVRRMQMEREHACDDYVLRHGTQPSHYAEELLSMVRALGTPSNRSAQPAFAALAMARRSEFEGRMLSILDPRLDRHPIRRGRALMGIATAIAVILPLAALHPYREPASGLWAPSMIESAAAPRNVEPATTSRSIILPGAPSTDHARDSVGPRAAADSSSRAATNTAPLATAVTQAVVPPVDTKAAASAVMASCDEQPGRTRGTSTSIHSDDNGVTSPHISYLSISTTRCASALIHGRIAYADDETDVLRMPESTIASFRERSTTTDRELHLTPAGDGSFTRAYSVNGATRAFDDDARTWFASFLPLVLAETGINVVPRVTRWYAQGGTANVLRNIEALRSTGAKRTHYEAMLQGRSLKDVEIDAVFRHAASQLQSSSGDLRAVLSQGASMRGAGNGILSAAVELATSSISSSGDRTAVLQLFGEKGDRDMLLMIARVARSIQSSGDEARLLMSLVERYHSSGDRSLYEEFYRTARAISSAGDARDVLTTAIPYAVGRTTTTLALIAASRDIASSGDRAAVMIALAQQGGLRDRETRDAFFEAASGIPSEGDRSRVLRAAGRD